jgi:hypothetical protein
MKSQAIRTALTVALGFFVATVPGYCTTLYPTLAFGTNLSTGTITVDGTPGTTETLASITGVEYDTLFVSNAPSDSGYYSNINALLSYSVSGGVATLKLTAGAGGLQSSGVFSNVTAGTVILQETMSPLTYTSSASPSAGTFTTSGLTSGSTVNVEFANATSLIEAPILLQDLNTSYATAGTTGGISNGSQTGTSGTGLGTVTTFNASSETLSATLTPEPVSSLMLGSGLLALAFFGRKRLMQN